MQQCDGAKKNGDIKSGMAIGMSADVVVNVITICTYYPLFTSTDSHSPARSKFCDYNKKSPTERKMALKRIKTMSRKGALEKESF